MARGMKTRSVGRATTRPRAASKGTRRAGWNLRRSRGLQILESSALGKLGWLVHAFSTRPGGSSPLGDEKVLNLGFTEWDERAHVEKNRLAFAVALGARDMPLVTLRQIHSDVISVAAAPGPGTGKKDSPKADALITHDPGLLLAVQTADCVPILLADKKRSVIAAIHAGWRGTLARIAVKTLGRMQMEYGTRPGDVVAALGPAIGRCCYEVGPEVAQAFATQFPAALHWFDGPFEQLAHGEEPLWLPWLTMMPPGHVPPPPRVQLDLRAANRWQLVDAGVPESQIDVSDLCTACRRGLLFSYRREGAKAGRLMAAIGIRK